MSDLTEYFHKKYYPDMPIEAVHNAIYSNKNIFNAAVNHVQQKHYPDINPAIIANKFGGKNPNNKSKTTDIKSENKDEFNYEDKKNNYIPEKVNNWKEPNYVAGLNSEGHYGYNGNDTINYDPNSQIENINNPWWIEHEKYHHYQTLSGRNPKERRQRELDEQVQKMIEEHPDYQFLPKNKLIRGSIPNAKGQKSFVGAEDLIYENPKTLEGEARLYEDYISNGGASIFPKN